MIADCIERQKPRPEVTTAQALMKPNESKLIKDFVGALLSVSFYRDPCCTYYTRIHVWELLYTCTYTYIHSSYTYTCMHADHVYSTA